MIETFSLGWWEVFLGGICTLAIYSFLVKENSVYRFFEHNYIGIATGITVVYGFERFLWPKIFKPILGFDISYFPDGTVAEPYNKLYLLYLIPMAVGLLYYFILSKRYAWLAQIAIGVSLGVGGGLAFKGFFNQFMPQLYDSFRPLYSEAGAAAWIGNVVFFAVLLSSMFYFFFTFKRKSGGVIEKFSTTGRWMMMGCFGAFFGTTIMARMALLVERLQFFISDWFPMLFGAA